MRNCWVNCIFSNITLSTVIIVIFAVSFECTTLFFHAVSDLPSTCDTLANTAHSLRVSTYHTKCTYIMYYVVCSNRFFTDTRICEGNVLWNRSVKMVGNHNHIQMIINRVMCEW